jgi:hypothetical protein
MTVDVTTGGTVVVVQYAAPQIVDVVARGPQGPQGPQGLPGPAGDGSNLGGYPIALASLSANDLLAFDGGAWTNKPQAEVTDAGNF